MDNFKKTLEEASSDKDIRQAFRIEEALLELDTKLGYFVEEKYEALDLPDVANITNMIEKFNGKHPNIALG